MADHEDTSPEIYFEPIVKLAPVEVKNLEEDEEEIFKMRAKLYRYANEESPAEWKERGTGEIKLLKKQGDTEGKVRILMRRDKTFKICANHYISPEMELKPNCGSDKAFVWNTPSDFADEEPKPETLAIRFGNAENAKKFKEKFEDCQRIMRGEAADEKKDEEPENEAKEEEKSKEADEVAEKLGGMTVNDAEKTEKESEKEPAKTEESKGEEKSAEESKAEESSKAETSKEESKGSGDAKEES